MIKKFLIFILLVATTASLAYAWHTTNTLRDQAFEIDRLEAEADTARNLTDSLQSALGDSVTAFQQRVVQIELEKDSIDEALQEESALRLAAELSLDTVFIVDTVAPMVTPEEDSVRIYDFAGEQGPFKYRGGSRLFPNYTQVFSVVISSDPVLVTARVTCGDGGIVRRANLLLQAPQPWRLRPSEVQQDPDVCNATTMLVPSFWMPTWERAVWGIVGGVIGYAIGSRGGSSTTIIYRDDDDDHR